MGIFLVSFYLKFVKGSATFYAALLTEVGVIYCFIFTSISYLWYIVVGCLLVVFISISINFLTQHNRTNYPNQKLASS